MMVRALWRCTLLLGAFLITAYAVDMTVPASVEAASCEGAPAPCAEDSTIDNCVQCHSMTITGGNRNGTDRQITISPSSNRHILGPPMADWTSTVAGMISKGAPGAVEKTAAYLNSNYCPTCSGPILSSSAISGVLSDQATVSWTTSGSGFGDLPATSCVLYGTSLTSMTGNTCDPGDPSYDSNSTDLVTTHSVTVTGLTGLTKYYVVHQSVAGGQTATYTLAATFTTPPSGGGGGGGGALGTIVSLSVGDYNSDFNLDLGVGASTKNHVIAYLGNGSGGFTEGQTLANVGTTPTALTSGGVKGDFNGDSLDDLAVANFGSKDIVVFLGTSPSGFETTAVSSIPLADPPTAVATGDFDEDGILDLAVATVQSDGLLGHVLLFTGQDDGSGDGTGHFTGPVTSIDVEVSTVLSPTITSITPSTVDCTGLPVDITVTGTLLLEGLSVTLDGVTPLTVLSVSADSTSFVARVPDGIEAGTHSVTAEVGGLPPASGTLIVEPRPMTIDAISPSSKIYGVDSSGQIAITGSHFVLGATVSIGPLYGTTVAGTSATASNPFVFVNSSYIKVWVGNTEFPAGSYDVTVINPDACAGSATVLNGFSLSPPQPTIELVSPTPVSYGITSSRAITISGTNFLEGAEITVGSLSGVTVLGTNATASLPFVWVSKTNLKFYWDNTSLPPGPYSVEVTNPSVAGGLSVVSLNSFTVEAPQPAISLVSPTPLSYGVSSSTQITISGLNFLAGATITVGSISGTTVPGSSASASNPFVWTSGSTIRFYWNNTALAPGTYDVQVTNPLAGGGGEVILTGGFVVEGPVPGISSVGPTPLTYGISSSTSISVYGENFVEGATIEVGGLSGTTVYGSSATSSIPFVFVSKTVVKFYWPNTSLAPGTYDVHITNPVEAGGLSTTSVGAFQVTAPQPTVTNLSPDAVVYGITNSTSVTVYGSNFIEGATITLGSLSGTTVYGTSATVGNPFVYVSGSTLKFYWTDTSLSPGTYSIQVVNPPAAGGLSTALASAFTVSPAQPAISTVAPNAVIYDSTVGSSISIYGTGFIQGASITVGSLSGATVYGTSATASNPYVWVNDGHVKFYWPGTSLPAGTYSVNVTNPVSSGGLATVATDAFSVAPAQPVVDSASAITYVYGVTSSRSTSIYGTGFVLGATLTVGPLSGTVVAGTAATASKPFVWVNKNKLAFYWNNTSMPVGSHAVQVVNPPAAGGLVGALADVVTITAPVPTVTFANPPSVTYGSTSKSVSISGSNFILGATITVGSLSGTSVSGGAATASKPFTWYSGTKMYFYWPSTSLPPGTYDVEVTNPAEAGGLSSTFVGGFVVTP